jgi:type VI secretion system FHA domain protein
MPVAAAPPAAAVSLPNHLDATRKSPAPAQPNGFAVAQAPVMPRPAAATPAPAAAPGHDATLEALLRGLGLPDLQTKHSGPELAELVGAMLREATAGAMQTLMARSVTKRESRIEMTMIGSQANNPLKFFPDPGSALSQMLSKTTGGYMKPVRAFSNAFEDLQAHELAVMAGMHAALSSILARFDPAAIEKRLEVPTVMDKMMASSRKAKMWDRLVLLYADISREADDDFQRLFGESFANAYEEQIERLHGREK